MSNHTPFVQLGAVLQSRQLTLMSAESCAGGLFASHCVAQAGASRWFLGGVVAYSNELKSSLLAVPETVLNSYGAVSPACACAMAEGCLALSNATIAVAETGVAGPSGGTVAKPVGMVCIAVAMKGLATTHTTVTITGDRDYIRMHTSAMMAQCVQDYMVD